MVRVLLFNTTRGRSAKVYLQPLLVGAVCVGGGGGAVVRVKGGVL